MKLLLYCTKAKPYIRKDNKHIFWTYTNKQLDFPNTILNGKIVGECDYEVEEICSEKLDIGVGFDPLFYTETIDDITKGSCLTQYEIENYLGCKFGGEQVGYAIHIKNLHIFDKPKELKYTNLTKAPQNMCYGWTLDNEFLLPDVCVVISIRPQWLCKILNGEKEIEVRRKVLKEMLEND